MKRFLIALAIMLGWFAFPGTAHADTTVDIGTPAVACTQDNGLYRVFGHLVIVMEYCTEFDIDPPDTLVVLMGSYGNPQTRCDTSGGRYEFLGNPNGFNLKICWNADYIIVPPKTQTVWDGVTPRVCIDADGAVVTENQNSVLTSYPVPPAVVTMNTLNKIINHLYEKFAAWKIDFQLGECLDDRSMTLYITPAPAPGQPLWSNADDGYAYINGFGIPAFNIGFVFTRYLGPQTMASVAAHEIGHAFGLQHPLGYERSIMGDGHDWTLDFSDSDKIILNSRLARV